MAKTSLTNFVVSMNRRFRRSRIPFKKSLQLRFYGAAECFLSYFKTVLGLKGISSWMFGVVRDALWAILVHEPGRLTNRLPDNPVLVGGQLTNIKSKKMSLLEVGHEMAQGLYDAGIIDATTMRAFFKTQSDPQLGAKTPKTQSF